VQFAALVRLSEKQIELFGRVHLPCLQHFAQPIRRSKKLPVPFSIQISGVKRARKSASGG
jgi:hypothetical protein